MRTSLLDPLAPWGVFLLASGKAVALEDVEMWLRLYFALDDDAGGGS